MAYCPSCISFREDCNPDVEDYNSPCEYYATKNGGAMNEGTKNILRQAGLGRNVERVEAGRCPCCDRGIDPAEFRDDISRREFRISGMCQACQDSVWPQGKQVFNLPSE